MMGGVRMDGLLEKAVLARTMARMLGAPLTADQLPPVPRLPSDDPNGEVSEGWRLFVSAVQRLHEQPERLEGVREDYARLFVGPGHLLAPPWESVYRTQERILCGTFTLQVQEAYWEAGLTLETGNREPEDHIAFELAFLAELDERAASTEAIGGDSTVWLERRRRFVEEHLCHWLPRFIEDVLAHSRTDLYRAVALVLRDFLRPTSGSIQQHV